MKATTYIDFVQTVLQMDRSSKLHDSILKGMNIQSATGLMHAQAATLKALGAIALCKAKRLNSMAVSHLIKYISCTFTGILHVVSTPERTDARDYDFKSQLPGISL
ncbi:hypothetical protein H6F75_13495 [Nodosilinea sp. FACHB-131]|uniref:hypothetical protein n=1 Tax=Cyanophyceae TaxID=3028117 RepID=UPI001688F841|nr:hypothetical protein [Nodosilinea sp. FACHB-131]MBD1874502.1 hypothetical protein [Nodosilinea sp. FACHB-131]